jgi:hypothetical protein
VQTRSNAYRGTVLGVARKGRRETDGPSCLYWCGDPEECMERDDTMDLEYPWIRNLHVDWARIPVTGLVQAGPGVYTSPAVAANLLRVERERLVRLLYDAKVCRQSRSEQELEICRD